MLALLVSYLFKPLVNVLQREPPCANTTSAKPIESAQVIFKQRSEVLNPFSYNRINLLFCILFTALTI
jgi:hypothetical protein